MPRQHAIYGLYLPEEPNVVLYAGSWRVATLDERLRQHREGGAPLSRKMAARCGIDTADLQMRVLAYWISGVDPNPEGEITLRLQAQGWCRWNFPHTLSSEDSRRGARVVSERMTHEERSDRSRAGAHNQAREGKVRGGHIGGLRVRELALTPEGHDLFVRNGRIGGAMGARKTNSIWGKTRAAFEARTEAGGIGGRNGSHQDKVRSGRIGNCVRYHTDRPKVDRLCAECAGKAALDNHPKPV